MYINKQTNGKSLSAQIVEVNWEVVMEAWSTLWTLGVQLLKLRSAQPCFPSMPGPH